MRERYARYRKENTVEFLTNAAHRRAAKLNATPPWADLKAIQAKYRRAAHLTKKTGIPHHVDHIVPLQHPDVCGLHIAANLQPLSASENLAKNNSFDGTMDNETWRNTLQKESE